MERKPLLVSVVLLALVMMGSVAFISWESVSSFARREELVSHSYLIMTNINRMLSFLEDEETGERGYFITGSSSYLTPYSEAIKRSRNEILLLKNLTRDDPFQQKNLDELQSLSERRLTYLKAGVSIRQKYRTPDPEQSLLIMDLAKSDMDRIRSVIKRMRSEESLRVANYRKESDLHSDRVHRVILAGYLLASAMIMISLAFLFRELSAHERAERENRRLTREYEDLYDYAPCGYHSIDKNGLMVRINKTELGWLGYEAHEVVGVKHYHEFMTPASREVYEREFDRFKESGMVRDVEFEFVRKDGSHFWALSNATAIRDLKGGFLLSRSVLIDITDRIRDRKVILDLNDLLSSHAKELEEKNKELEGFTYSVSHDLRSPLRAIDGFSRILMEDYGKGLDREAMRLLGIVRENTARMSQLIDDLLTLSRMGKAPLEKRWVDMTSLAKKAVGEVGVVSSFSGSILVGDLPRAFGDSSLLFQVFLNLLSNSVKFTQKTESPRISVEGQKRDGEVVYSISDNGEGFEMKYYKKLFGVFQRLHSQEDFPGTGVGLAIVHRIVSRHGGRVWAVGKPKEGATFFFSIPVPLVPEDDQETFSGRSLETATMDTREDAS
ncbi:sensor histidine kinase [Leptospirillum ferrooxidans]|uniref:histidine kinase n=1 Tax=Leptospirillum ferrooxidans (strain C2-3) TaxID=1162668 RepID=I0IRS9_LEPFC|nr:CHASE3 domain-containing protein [Leptospirillum ferrooxidans]BAM07978.1 putative multisensor signal transduction histidine kinase [Leptospirillum ferrooxidans C2-3]